MGAESTPYIVLPVAVFMVLLVTSLGIFSLRAHYRRQQNWDRGSGVIIDKKHGPLGRSDSHLHSFLVKYEYNGEHKQAWTQFTEAMYRVNQEVKILIDPQNPEKINIETRFNVFTPILLIAIGAVILITALPLLRTFLPIP